MAALVDTMTNSSPQRKRLIDGLKLVLPTVILVAVGFAFLRRANQTLLPVALDFATASAIGITSGLTTRWSLKTRAGLLRSIVAVAMAISALIILGIVTWGEAGIKMLSLRQAIDWNGLGQVMVSASSALIALRAWSWREPIVTPPPDSPPEPIVPRSQPAGGLTQSDSPVPPPRRIATRSRAPSRTSAISEIPRPFVMPRWKMPRIALPHINLRGLLRLRESQVKFTGVTEQRCPYCLDVITKNDPRGVRVCSICHTPHHADCWAMTGVCQVPHYHG